MLEKQLPGVFVYSIEVGSDLVEDELNGFFMNANHQIRYVHDKLQQIEQLETKMESRISELMSEVGELKALMTQMLQARPQS